MSRSGLIFNPATGLYAPDTAEIREGVAEDWKQAFFDPDLPPLDTEPTTPAGQLIDAEVAEIEAKNAELLYLSSMFNPKASDGRWQDALGYIYFLQRKLDEPTVVTCQLTGLNGTAIPYGALVQSVNGHTLICNRSVTLGEQHSPAARKAAAALPAEVTSPTASVAQDVRPSVIYTETTFRVAENGPIEIPAHSVSAIITTVPGWDTVDNEAAGVVGRDLETRSEFEARRAASVAANAHGSTGALFGTIANLPGVLDVQALENIGPAPVVKYGVEVPAHGVTICVAGGEDAAIAEAIYNKKGNGADTGGNTAIAHTAAEYHNAVYDYLIMRPTPINFWIRVTLGPTSVPTEAQIAALIDALYQDFHGLNATSGNSRIGLASTVYASRFYGPAMAVAGVRNIQSIEIALSADPPEVAARTAAAEGDGCEPGLAPGEATSLTASVPQDAGQSGIWKDVITINGDQEPVIGTANITVLVL